MAKLPGETTIDVLSELFGVSLQRIPQLVKDGILVKTRLKGYDLARSVQGYIRYLKRGSESPEGGYAWPVVRWCEEVGGDRHQMIQAIKRMDIKPIAPGAGPNGSDLYNLRQLHIAAVGDDIDAQRLRKTKEEADKLELSNRAKRRELISRAEIVAAGQRVVADCKQIIKRSNLSADDQDDILRELNRLYDVDQNAK